MIGIALLFIRGQLFRFTSWLGASSTHMLIAGCVILGAWGVYERSQADKWHTEAVKHLAALREAQSASSAELARANAERDAAIKHEKDANNATDKRVELARADDARRLVDYERRLRAARNQGDSKIMPATASQDVAQSSDGQGGNAVMDATLADDLRICTLNTRRLLEIHAEAVGE